MTYKLTAFVLFWSLLAATAFAGGSNPKSQIYVMKPHDGDAIWIQPIEVERETFAKTRFVTSVRVSFVLDAETNTPRADAMMTAVHMILNHGTVSDSLISADHQAWIRSNGLVPQYTLGPRNLAKDLMHVLPLSVTFRETCSDKKPNGCFIWSFPDGNGIEDIKGVLAVYQIPGSARYHFARADIRFGVGDNVIIIREGEFENTFYEMVASDYYPFEPLPPR